MGSFTSPDPLMASAKANNPQTWNRYSYALNNPLRFIDPNGMEVPESCIEDPECNIKIKVNVIYEKGSKLNKKEIEKDYIKKAQKDYKNSNIQFEFEYSEGSYKDDYGELSFTGLKSDSLNVYFLNKTPSFTAGVAFNLSDKTAVAIVNPNHLESLSLNLWPLGTNTMEHEVAHHLLGHTDQERGSQWNYLKKESDDNWKVFRQSWGASIPEFRQGTKTKIYAVPADPELNKPEK